MNWKDLNPEIKKANQLIKESNNFDHYNNVKRRYWQGFKHGIGIAYKIFKTTNSFPKNESKILNMQSDSQRSELLLSAICQFTKRSTQKEIQEVEKWIKSDFRK